jgi:hypothetical protein
MENSKSTKQIARKFTEEQNFRAKPEKQIIGLIETH